MKAIVKEIQVGGCYLAESLEDACAQYGYYRPDRTKIIFVIELPSGEIKQITIRDEDNETVAYGNFEGLPSFLDYAKEVSDEREDERNLELVKYHKDFPEYKNPALGIIFHVDGKPLCRERVRQILKKYTEKPSEPQQSLLRRFFNRLVRRG